VISSAFLFVSLATAQEARPSPKLKYPETRKQDIADEYHGTKIADPYRWLEDDTSPETAAWVAAQNEVTFGFLRNIPQRKAIQDRLTKLWNYERFGIPAREGDRYVFSRNEGLQNQSVVWIADKLDATPRVLIDPNKLSADGTVALAGSRFSDDGSLMAYGISASGSDWVQYKVRDVRTGADLDDTLQWIKFSGATWTKDGKGFFYGRYAAPEEGQALTGVNKFQKLYYHRIGDMQEKDILVYERPDQPDWSFGAGLTEDGRFLILSVGEGTERKNRLFYRDLLKSGIDYKPTDADK
jgi:prolyl oligopeptidase